MENIVTLEWCLEKIKENTEELLKQNIPSRVLMQNAIPRGMTMIKGQIDRQTVIDLCAIAITVLIQTS